MSMSKDTSGKAERITSPLSPGATGELVLSSLRENTGLTALHLLVWIHCGMRTKEIEINKAFEINLVRYQGRKMLSFS